MAKKVYASIWYHPNGKWKLNESITIEDEKVVGSAVGGSFLYTEKDVPEEAIKHALLDLLFWDHELSEEENKAKIEELMEEVEVNFVDDEKLEEIKEKYPEEWLEENGKDEDKLRYIG